ncbi:MAG: hypothetical protein ACFBSC_11400 [Microcoleaceae cyanobacterium]
MLVNDNPSGHFGQPPTGNFSQSSSHPESVRITLSGSRQGVLEMIRLLHNSSVILGSEWSNAIPIKNSTEVISVAIRIVRVE